MEKLNQMFDDVSRKLRTNTEFRPALAELLSTAREKMAEFERRIATLEKPKK